MPTTAALEHMTLAWDKMKKMVDDSPDQVNMDSVCARGLGSISLARSRSFICGRSGQFRLRVLAVYSEFLKRVLGPAFSITEAFGGPATHEVRVESKLWIAGVIAQIHAQGGMAASQGMDRSMDGVLIYRFTLDDPPTAQQAKFVKEGLKLGVGPQVYPVYTVEEKVVTV